MARLRAFGGGEVRSADGRIRVYPLKQDRLFIIVKNSPPCGSAGRVHHHAVVLFDFTEQQVLNVVLGKVISPVRISKYQSIVLDYRIFEKVDSSVNE